MTELETRLAEALRAVSGDSYSHTGPCFMSDYYDDCVDTTTCVTASEALAAYDAAKAEEDIIKSHCPTCDGTCRYQDHMEEYDQ